MKQTAKGSFAKTGSGPTHVREALFCSAQQRCRIAAMVSMACQRSGLGRPQRSAMRLMRRHRRSAVAAAAAQRWLLLVVLVVVVVLPLPLPLPLAVMVMVVVVSRSTLPRRGSGASLSWMRQVRLARRSSDLTCSMKRQQLRCHS